MNYNEKIEEWADSMNPCPVWEEGTDAQQSFADELVEEFCVKFAKYLYLAVRDNLIDEDEVFDITNVIFDRINEIDDSRWWCNKKSSSEISIALKLLEDYEDYKDLLKKLRKEYE